MPPSTEGIVCPKCQNQDSAHKSTGILRLGLFIHAPRANSHSRVIFQVYGNGLPSCILKVFKVHKYLLDMEERVKFLTELLVLALKFWIVDHSVT